MEAGGLVWPPIFARAKQFRPAIHRLTKKTQKRTVLEADDQKWLGRKRKKAEDIRNATPLDGHFSSGQKKTLTKKNKKPNSRAK